MNDTMRNTFAALAAVAALAGCGRKEMGGAVTSPLPTTTASYVYQSGDVDRWVDCETGNTIYRYTSGTAAVPATAISAPMLRQICTRSGLTPGF